MMLVVLIAIPFLVSCDSIKTTEPQAIQIAKEYAKENVPMEELDIEDYHYHVYFNDDDFTWNVKFAHKVHGSEMINEDGTIDSVSPGCPNSFGISVKRLLGRVVDVYHC